MKRSIIFFTILLLFIAAAGTAAHLLFPTPLNRILQPGSKDVSFLEVEFIDVEPRLEWELLIPWSRDGLGRADRYLGEVALGIPKSGGAFAPMGLAIQGSLIAIGDRGDTRLYDKQGNFLGLRAGNPIGFMPDGTLVTAGGKPPYTLYSQDGQVIWKRDPSKEVEERFLADKGELTIIGGFGDDFMSPFGEVYVRTHKRLGKAFIEPDPDAPGGVVERWRDVKVIDATTIYNRNGELVACFPEATPTLIFTPNGTAFTTPIKQDIGHAHREFTVNKGRFTLKRTLYLPSMTIRYVGKDGTILCLHDYDETVSRYTVYQEGKKTSPRFTLPAGSWWFIGDWDGYFYTAEPIEKGFQIRCWQWPKPER